MSDPVTGDAGNSGDRGRRLDAWKEIAAYLKRDVTTERRWEKREGLPVRRHRHDKLGSVFAFTSEIDAWSRARGESATALPRPEPLNGSSASVPIAKWRTWALVGSALAAVALLAR